MIQALLRGGLSLLRTLAPAAINWGVNKLVNSSFGQKNINPALMNNISAMQPQQQIPAVFVPPTPSLPIEPTPAPVVLPKT